MRIGVGEVTCTWSGCNSGAEGKVDGRWLCRKHFYNLAMRRLEEYRRGLKRATSLAAERTAISQFLSELISQTTTLVATAKFLSPQQHRQLFELSLSAAELHKRVQRSPRMPRNIPVIIYGERDSGAGKEQTTTVDVSKRGVAIATSRLWIAGEELWIEQPGSQLRARARVAWVKKKAPLQFVIGLEILDCENFWEAEKAPRGGNANKVTKKSPSKR